MTETRIYIGLNDSETLDQKFETAKYVSVLKNVCRSYKVAFSVANGGYMHEGGRYTHETSRVLSLIDADPAVVGEIAKDLCAFFNQESVLVTENEIKAYFVNESL